MIKKPWKYPLILLFIFSVSLLIAPSKVTGEIQPITEAQEQLEGISKEEQETLEKLFTYTQDIEEMERQQASITKEIERLIIEIDSLDESIVNEQEEYDYNLELLELVLVSYQRSGPASYLDILLNAKDLTSFIKNLNLIKDITRNTGELLDSIEEMKLLLEEKKQNLSENKSLLEIKRAELEEPIAQMKRLLEEQEEYLDSLEEERDIYEKHLDNLKFMWDNLKDLFSEIVDEFSRIVREGHFTYDDLKIEFGFLSVKGALHEDTFNRILNDNSTLTDMFFAFDDDGVKVEVPEYNLVLEGKFVIEDSYSLLFLPEGGSFYEMELEIESIEELFSRKPLLVDFFSIAGDMLTIDIELKDVHTEDGYLKFTIDTGLWF